MGQTPHTPSPRHVQGQPGPAPSKSNFLAAASLDAAAAFPKASCTLITLHQTGFPKLALPAKTRVVTAWQWLLE